MKVDPPEWDKCPYKRDPNICKWINRQRINLQNTLISKIYCKYIVYIVIHCKMSCNQPSVHNKYYLSSKITSPSIIHWNMDLGMFSPIICLLLVTKSFQKYYFYNKFYMLKADFGQSVISSAKILLCFESLSEKYSVPNKRIFCYMILKWKGRIILL